jgi:hypothetical protein
MLIKRIKTTHEKGNGEGGEGGVVEIGIPRDGGDGKWHGAPDSSGNEMVPRKQPPPETNNLDSPSNGNGDAFPTQPMMMTTRTSTISVPLVPYVAPSDTPVEEQPIDTSGHGHHHQPSTIVIQAEQHHPSPLPVDTSVEFVPLGHGTE